MTDEERLAVIRLYVNRSTENPVVLYESLKALLDAVVNEIENER